MKSKGIVLTAVGLVCASLLTGCGDSSTNIVDYLGGKISSLGSNKEDVSVGLMQAEGEQQTTDAPGEDYEVYLSEEDQALARLEAKHASEGLSAAEYMELAKLYQQSGQIKKQRDMLELCWRLYGDTEGYGILQDITVNAREEGEALIAQAELLLQNLDIPEYHNEAASVIYSQDWFGVMMPRLKEGRRNYYLEADDAGGVLVWSSGYDKTGMQYTNVWYRQGEEIVILRQTPERIQMVTTSLQQGSYEGAFESWTCYSASGDAYHESGVLGQGKLIGDYTVRVHKGTGPVDLIAMWATRESLDFTEYTGSFAEDGTTTLEQPAASRLGKLTGSEEGMDQLIYAYTQDQQQFLFLNVPEGTQREEKSFGAQMLGAIDYPEFQFYTPVQVSSSELMDVQINARDVKVRVYDSNLEWFDGTRWHTVGTVAEYVAQDPFARYEDRSLEVPEELQTQAGGAVGEGTDSLHEEVGSGSIKKAAATTVRPGSSSAGNTGNSAAGSIGSAGSTGSTGGDNTGDSGSAGTGTYTPDDSDDEDEEDSGDSGNSGGDSNDSGSGGGDSGNSGGNNDSGSGGNSGDSGNSGGDGNDSGSGGDSGDSGNSGGDSNDSGNSGGSGGNSGSDGDDIEWSPDIM